MATGTDKRDLITTRVRAPLTQVIIISVHERGMIAKYVRIWRIVLSVFYT